MEYINLKDLYIEEIEKLICDMGERKYRAQQIFSWIYRGVCNFDEMTDLSFELREKLSAAASLGCMENKASSKSRDGTVKFLFGLNDGNIIETVLMKYRHGNSVCVSSQVGCRMGCVFCASARCGFVRSLSPGEIVDQVLGVMRITGTRISNVVIMGIGEPFDNYDNVLKSVKLINHHKGLNIGMRHIGISTSGIVPNIKRFAHENVSATLSISLHAPDDKLRNIIMPVNRKHNIKKLLEVCKYYTEITNRRVTFEYALIRGFNDSDEQAHKLAKLLDGMLFHVNIITLNPVEGSGYKNSSRERMIHFRDVLNSLGITATIRRELGSDIRAACGQLRTRHIQQ